MIKIAIQGQEGSFHSIAAGRMLKSGSFELEHCSSFSEVFQLLDAGSVEGAVVAIENSLFGSINQVFQQMDSSDWEILAEHYLRIEHCLIGVQGADIEGIKSVRSQSMALAQCETFLDKELSGTERIEAEDTAGSVRDIVRIGETDTAAIASRQAAELYGAQVLAEGIETNKKNFTRFLLLTKSDAANSVMSTLHVKAAAKATPNKATFILRTNHESGALVSALQVFSGLGCNLSKIESRPIVGTPNRYMFYLDLLLNGARVGDCIEQVSGLGFSITHKGTYFDGGFPNG